MFDPEGQVRLLRQFQVEYVMVGGFAAGLQGALRPTMDIDVVPRWDRENLERLCAALASVNATSISGPPVTGDSITPDVLIDREVMTWTTDLGRIDTLVGIPDRDGMPVYYTELEARSSPAELGSTIVLVASLDDIIVSKEFASRAKDARALPELRQLRERQRARRSGSPPQDQPSPDSPENHGRTWSGGER